MHVSLYHARSTNHNGVVRAPIREGLVESTTSAIVTDPTVMVKFVVGADMFVVVTREYDWNPGLPCRFED